MKRLFLLIALGLVLTACGTAEQRREFWNHDSVYKNTGHMVYSWWGYKQPTEMTGEKSRQEGWWGRPVEGP